jgi:hypothetical protein
MTQSAQSEALSSVISYYLAQGAMSDPRSFAAHFAALPAGVPELVKVLQGTVIHVFWAERYGLKLNEARQAEVQIRPVAAKLARLFELDAAPLTSARPLEHRLVSNCRDHALLFSAMLRAKGIAARSRCGFGTYFTPGKYEDHWVCEYWHAQEDCWVMLDPQLDDLQKEVLGIRFDSLDMPAGAFVTAGEAWQMCRAGRADPESFGIFQWHGWDFIRGNLLRDLLALNKFEVLPWDSWGALETPFENCTPEHLALLDKVAALATADNQEFAAMRAIYAENEAFHAPDAWAV